MKTKAKPGKNGNGAARPNAVTFIRPPIPTPEPLPALLDDVKRFLGRYISMTDAQLTIIAVWIYHTHAIEAFDFTGYLHISSPEKRSGKSRLMESVSLLAANSWFTTSASAASIARIAGTGVTVFLDEADTFISSGAGDERSELLRGVLNSGFQRGGTYSRCVGQGSNIQVVNFPTFGPKAIAGLGALPDTIADRSFPIRMKRAQAEEVRERFYIRDVIPLASVMRERISASATSSVPALKDARPPRIDELNDRQGDISEPLLAIAEMAGPEWADRLRESLREIFRVDGEDDSSLGVRLLAAIRDAFEDLPDDYKMPLGEMQKFITNADDSEFREYKRGEAISTAEMARLLKSYSIRAIRFSVNGKDCRGYRHSQFVDAWKTYLPSTSKAEEIFETPEGPEIREPGED